MRRRSPGLRRWAAVLALLVAAGAVYGSFLPLSRRSLLHSSGPLHPLVHLVLFGVIGWLAAWGIESAVARAAVCAAIAVLGCSTEVIEWRLYANPLEYTDMVVDAMGAVIGTGLGAITADFLLRRGDLRRGE